MDQIVQDIDDAQVENILDQELILVDMLGQMGVNESDITKLKQNGVTTIKAIQMMTSRNLLKIKGFSEVKVDKLKDAARKLLSSGFMSATELHQRRQFVFKISTGSKEFDKLIGGGIQTMSVTEAFGEFRTGKTQLAHTLCVTCQMPPELGGANGKAAYIDTEGTFRPERIFAIAERFGLDPEIAVGNISYARAHNSEHQMELLNELCACLAEDRQYRLVVIDSIIALFRTDFAGRGELNERQQKLGQMLIKLTRIAEEFNIAVYLTNQMTADPGCTLAFGDNKKPVGGHVLAHASATRLYLRKGRGETRVCKIWDSPDVPEAEAMYQITTGGIADTTD